MAYEAEIAWLAAAISDPLPCGFRPGRDLIRAGDPVETRIGGAAEGVATVLDLDGLRAPFKGAHEIVWERPVGGDFLAGVDLVAEGGEGLSETGVKGMRLNTEAGAPFAVVTRFAPEHDVEIAPRPDRKSFEEACDHYRPTDNLFYAMRLDGVFRKIQVRTINPPPPGTRLIDAAKSQSIFDFADIAGTLVGIWSPTFSSEFSVQGYHFHFLSDDRAHGGHVLELETDMLRLQVEPLTDFRLILPETENFLKADLGKDTSKELDSAEKSHYPPQR